MLAPGSAVTASWELTSRLALRRWHEVGWQSGCGVTSGCGLCSAGAVDHELHRRVGQGLDGGASGHHGGGDEAEDHGDRGADVGSAGVQGAAPRVHREQGQGWILEVGRRAGAGAFFRDCQEWEWIPRRFDVATALRTPRSINPLLGPDPRVIADDIWAKLL
jgi:hypothetical protein